MLERNSNVRMPDKAIEVQIPPGISEGRVGDRSQSFRGGTIKPIQLTVQGRLKTETIQAWDDRVWNGVSGHDLDFWDSQITYTIERKEGGLFYE